jgi:hypothetical protein
MAPTPAAMLQPIAAMAVLVMLVWLRLYQLRFAEMARKRIDAQAVSLSAPKDALLADTRASDNFRNLFELPVLFHAGVLALIAAGLQDRLFLQLAWGYVALRALHSLVHCTYNRVVHRFLLFAASSLLLFGFWLRLGWMLAR